MSGHNCSTTPLPPLHAGDRAALEALYHAANGADWSDNTNWLSSRPLRDWYGVITDANGRVTRLDLGSNELVGTVPPELGNLDNLVVLNLMNNDLSGAIPSEIGDLNKLHILFLGLNSLMG